jgi:hypothetical protein
MYGMRRSPGCPARGWTTCGPLPPRTGSTRNSGWAWHVDVLADLETPGDGHPLSERLAALRMRALSAAGRQSDAFALYSNAFALYEEMRGRLGEELGVDPLAELRETHLALLRGELERPPARPEPVVSRLPGQLPSFGRQGRRAGQARRADGGVPAGHRRRAGRRGEDEAVGRGASRVWEHGCGSCRWPPWTRRSA